MIVKYNAENNGFEIDIEASPISSDLVKSFKSNETNFEAWFFKNSDSPELAAAIQATEECFGINKEKIDIEKAKIFGQLYDGDFIHEHQIQASTVLTNLCCPDNDDMVNKLIGSGLLSETKLKQITAGFIIHQMKPELVKYAIDFQSGELPAVETIIQLRTVLVSIMELIRYMHNLAELDDAEDSGRD